MEGGREGGRVGRWDEGKGMREEGGGIWCQVKRKEEGWEGGMNKGWGV